MRMAEAVTIDGDETVSKAMPLFNRTDFVVVTDAAGKYAGALSAADLARFADYAGKTRVSTRARKGAVVFEGQAEAGKVIRLFADNRLEGLPVLDSAKKIKGVVDKRCVLEEVIGLETATEVKAGECVEPLSSIACNETASQANSLMLRSGRREIVVTDGSKAVGTLSALDLARKVKPFMRQPFKTTEAVEKTGVEEAAVEEIMSPLSEEDVVPADSSLAEAARLMAANGGRMLLVEEDGRLKGTLSFHGLLKSLAGARELGSPPKVEITGLAGEEKFMRESIAEECGRLLSKIGRDAELSLRVKGVVRKRRKEYEVKARLSVGGKRLHCSTPSERFHRANWDLHLAVKEVLAELKKRYEREVKKG